MVKVKRTVIRCDPHTAIARDYNGQELALGSQVLYCRPNTRRVGSNRKRKLAKQFHRLIFIVNIFCPVVPRP